MIRKIVREFDKEIPQSQTADNPMAPRGRAHDSQIVRAEKNLKLSQGGSSYR